MFSVRSRNRLKPHFFAWSRSRHRDLGRPDPPKKWRFRNTDYRYHDAFNMFRNNCHTATLKYSLSVFEKRLLYLTNSRFLCSRACFPFNIFYLLNELNMMIF